MAAVAVCLVAAVIAARSFTATEKRAFEVRSQSLAASARLAAASDLLTGEQRKFSVNHNRVHVANYWREINETKTRDKALAFLKGVGTPDSELAFVAQAKANSDALVTTETRSQALVLAGRGVPRTEWPGPVAEYRMSPADQAMSPEQKFRVARTIMFDAKYDADKAKIMAPWTSSTRRWPGALTPRWTPPPPGCR